MQEYLKSHFKTIIRNSLFYVFLWGPNPYITRFLTKITNITFYYLFPQSAQKKPHKRASKSMSSAGKKLARSNVLFLLLVADRDIRLLAKPSYLFSFWKSLNQICLKIKCFFHSCFDFQFTIKGYEALFRRKFIIPWSAWFMILYLQFFSDCFL